MARSFSYNYDPVVMTAGSMGLNILPNGPILRIYGTRDKDGRVPLVSVAPTAKAFGALSSNLTPQNIDKYVGGNTENLLEEQEKQRDAEHYALKALLSGGAIRLTDEQISRLLSIGSPAALSCAYQAMLQREQDRSNNLDLLIEGISEEVHSKKSKKPLLPIEPNETTELARGMDHQFLPPFEPLHAQPSSKPEK